MEAVKGSPFSFGLPLRALTLDGVPFTCAEIESCVALD
jgi:hypothetical protein